MTEPRTLYVFDIDGTLFNTGGNINVHKDGALHYQLGHGQFNTHKLSDGESYDFSEFRSGKLFRDTASPINAVLDQAKHIVHNQHETSKTILLTGRSTFKEKDQFIQAFKDHGFPIDKVEVYLAGNMGSGVPTDVSKLMLLKPYVLSKKYDKIIVWEDSLKNLDTLVKLAKYNRDCEIIGYSVDKSGRVAKYNSSINEGLEIPKHSLNIGRALMPQLGKDFKGFLSHLKDHGHSHMYTKAYPEELKATQSEFSHPIIQKLIKTKPDLKPILVSNDNYILDGHHRWLAALNTNKDKKIPIVKLSSNILDSLRLAKTTPGVEYRSMSDTEKRQKIKSVVKEAIEARLYK